MQVYFENDEVDTAFDGIMTALNEMPVGTALDVLTNIIAFVLVQCITSDEIETIIDDFPSAIRQSVKMNKCPLTKELH